MDQFEERLIERPIPMKAALLNAAKSAACARELMTSMSGSQIPAAVLLAQAWRSIAASAADATDDGSRAAQISQLPIVFPEPVTREDFDADIRALLEGYDAGVYSPDLLRIPLVLHAEILATTAQALRGRAWIPRFARGMLLITLLGAVGASVWWTAREPHFDVWRAEYFDNPRLEGAPVYVGSEKRIAFDWTSRAPVPALTSADYSIRWETRLVLDAESDVTFALSSDDGSRIFVDDQIVIDGWQVQAMTPRMATTKLRAGEHALRVEYFQRGGSAIINFKMGLGGQPPAAEPGQVLKPLLPRRDTEKPVAEKP